MSAQLNGIVVLIDLTNFSWDQAFRMTRFSFLKQVSEFFQGSSPVRVKAIHVFNEPFLFSTIFSALKPFLTSKNQQRVRKYFIYTLNIILTIIKKHF